MDKIYKKPERDNDKQKEPSVMKSIGLPHKHLSRRVDLRPWMSLIDRQGDMLTW